MYGSAGGGAAARRRPRRSVLPPREARGGHRRARRDGAEEGLHLGCAELQVIYHLQKIMGVDFWLVFSQICYKLCEISTNNGHIFSENVWLERSNYCGSWTLQTQR